MCDFISESAWSDVVANKIPGQYPAYQPHFSPVPQVFSRSSSNRSMSSASPIQVSGSSLSSFSSYSPSISAEPSPQVHFSPQVDWNSKHEGGVLSRQQVKLTPPPPASLRLSQTEVSMFREHSQDMTPDGVFLPTRSNGVVRFSVEGEDDEEETEHTLETTRRENGGNSRHSQQPETKTFQTIAEIANNFLGYDSSRRCSTPVLPSNQDSRRCSTPLMPSSQASSIGDEMADNSARLMRSGSLRKTSSYAFNHNPIVVVQNSSSNLSHPVLVIGPRTSLDQQKSEDLLPPRRKKKSKKKSESRQTTMDSLNVHGGNPKWMWKN